MKRLLLFLYLLALAGVLPARADGPEDQYVRIYGLIQEGDALRSSEQAAPALSKYIQAQTSLQQFQKVYPDWNPKVVNFRLNYLASKVSETSKVTGTPVAKPTTIAPATKPTTTAPSAAAKPAPPVAAPSAAAQPVVAQPTVAERQLAQLQEDVRRLQADKSNLEAKLKEALSAQPAALDPAALTKAQKQISDLMKENELLKSAADKGKPAAPAVADTKALDETKNALAAANKKLTDETKRADALAAEKVALQGRLDSMAKTTVDNKKLDDVRKALEEANHKLATQTETTKKLTTEKDSLQAQVKTLAANATAAEALKAENEILKKQLADTKALAANPKPDEETKRKLSEAETRIAALQSDAEILRLEKMALESRVKTLNTQTPAAPIARSTIVESRPSDLARIKSLESERDELAKKLDVANKELYGRKGREVSTKIEDLNNQIATLRARVQVFEARAVPYSVEELALFKRAQPQLASAINPNAGKKPISSLPGGTASLVASAQRHFAAKEFDQAEQDYMQILRRDENNAYTLANLAAIQLERGSLDDAEKSVKKALTTVPEDPYSLSILGYVKFRQEKYDDALDALSRAATLNPQSAEIQNYLGVTLSHKGLRGPAETALRKAITIDPGYAAAHNNLAVIYSTQTPPAVALARWHYQKALAAGHPRNAELEKSLDQKSATADAQSQ